MSYKQRDKDIPQGGGPLWPEICRQETLLAAWVKVRANAGAAGGDGISVYAFERRAPAELARLERELRDGTYIPGPLRHAEVPKDDGTLRRLGIPSVADRVVQTAAALVLGPLLDPQFEEESYGYRPGRSVRMAIDRVTELRREGYQWAVKCDIDEFFDSVPHPRLLARLERYVGEPPLLALVGRCLAVMGPDARGLPTGAPLSPLLSNLYLDDVDEAIAGKGARLVRYADDFVILCKTERLAREALAEVAALLAAEGLRLDPGKTRVLGYDDTLRFLGHVFVRAMVFDAHKGGVAPVSSAPVPPLPPFAAPPPSSISAPEAPRVLPARPGGAPEPGAAADGEPVEADPFATGDEGAPPLTRRAGLRVLHVLGSGRALGVRNQAFAVGERGNDIFLAHHTRVDRIEIGPAADASGAALRFALDTDTPLAFTDGHGRLVGMLAPRVSPDGALHLAQARLILDPEVRLDLARRLVVGRLRNQRALLGRRRRPLAGKTAPTAMVTLALLDDTAQVLHREALRAGGAPDIATAMGHEGYATQRFWRALDALLRHGWRLTARERRPPPDPVNIVLSFLASLLYRDMTTLVLRHGLHPGFGALHTPRDGHDACVSDLVEEFRAPLVEGLALYLFNGRSLARTDFIETEPGHWHLLPDGARRVVVAYEKATMAGVRSPRRGREVSWRGLMEEQVLAYRAHITSDAPYEPYRMDF